MLRATLASRTRPATVRLGLSAVRDVVFARCCLANSVEADAARAISVHAARQARRTTRATTAAVFRCFCAVFTKVVAARGGTTLLHANATRTVGGPAAVTAVTASRTAHTAAICVDLVLVELAIFASCSRTTLLDAATARTVGADCTRLTCGAARARRTAAVDIRFARRDRAVSTRVGYTTQVLTETALAVFVDLAMHSQAARRAVGTAAVAIALVTIPKGVVTTCFFACLRGAHVAQTIFVDVTLLCSRTAARRAHFAAIRTGLAPVAHAITTAGRHAMATTANASRAVCRHQARLTGDAPSTATATIDIAFVIVLDAVVAGFGRAKRKLRERTSHRQSQEEYGDEESATAASNHPTRPRAQST